MNKDDRTEYCRHCGEAITEPSAYCGNCGGSLAEGPPPTATSSSDRPGAGQVQAVAQSDSPVQGSVPLSSVPGRESAAKRRAWLPFAGIGAAVLLITGITAALLLALGGSAGSHVKNASASREQAAQALAAAGTITVSKSAPGLFAIVQAGPFYALVPAGWRATGQQAAGSARAEFADPQQIHSSTLTIVHQAGAGGNDHAQAESTRRLIAAKGYTQSFFGAIQFPGGRPAWRLTYVNGGVTHSTYFYSTCKNRDALIVDVSAPSASFDQQRAILGFVAAAPQPVSCK